MKLSLISANARQYQFRETPWSAATVNAIVAEGIDLAKFDPIPLIQTGNRFVVAGDGHSRFEAVRRLFESGRLPSQWKRGKDFDVPHRIVSDKEAQTLSWTANLSRSDFTPCEEARVFQAMLDAGRSLEEVASLAHRSTAYVRKTLPLNRLCRTIKQAMELSMDAGGVDKNVAQLMAAKFDQYQIGDQQQQELWHRVLKHADLTASFVRQLLDRIGREVAAKETQDVLFAIPASVAAAVGDLRERTQDIRRAERGLQWLLQCKDSGVLDSFPKLKRLLDVDGSTILADIKQQTNTDADLLGRMCLIA